MNINLNKFNFNNFFSKINIDRIDFFKDSIMGIYRIRRNTIYAFLNVVLKSSKEFYCIAFTNCYTYARCSHA